MKNEKLLQAIGGIDDELIYGAVNDTEENKQHGLKRAYHSTRSNRYRFASAAAIIVVIISAITIPIVLRQRGTRPSPVSQESTSLESTSIDDTSAGMETGSYDYLEDPTLFPIDFTKVPDGYDMTMSQDEKAIYYCFDNGIDTIHIEQRYVQDEEWRPVFDSYVETVYENDAIEAYEIKGCNAFLELGKDCYSLFYADKKYLIRVTATGNSDAAETLVRFSLTYENPSEGW